MTEQPFHGAWSAQERRRYRELGYWQERSLGEHLRLWANDSPHKTALVCGPERISYRQLDGLADRLAGGFALRGIESGDNVLIQMPNSIGLVASLFALFRLGARPILAMPGQKSADIDALSSLATPKAWLFPSRFLGNDFQLLALDMAKKHPTMQQWMIDSDRDPCALMEAYQQPALSLPSPDAGDVALLLLSGGTTGTPKLIPRTHADYHYNARATAEICQLSADSVYLAALAVAHNFTLSCPGVLGTLLSGGTVVLAQTAGCDEVFPLIEREKVTITALVPPLVTLWLECREWDDSDLSSLQLLQVGGARLESSLAARITPTLGCALQQVFGMAEGLICCTRLDDPPEVILHTQGRPISPHDRLRIVDEHDVPVPDGTSGELLTRGPYTIGGYYRADRQNAFAFSAEGDYRSGDRVRLTPEGNIVVEGRLKEQINRAGEKIAAAEVEASITLHPAILACVVIGVKDDRLGERICACIQQKAPLTLQELRQFLQQSQISDHKLPDQLVTIGGAWPLTAVGKIDKRQLAVLAQQVQSAENEFQAVVPLSATPLDVCYQLLKTEWSCDIAYEHNGVWTLALDRLAVVKLFSEYAQLELPDQSPRRWHSQTWHDNLQQALAALPFSRWRALGVSRFELAYLFHQLPQPLDRDEPLLELLIPRYEVHIQAGEAHLSARSAEDLALLSAYVVDADRPVASPQTDIPWLGQVQERICHQDTKAYLQRVENAVAEIAAGEYQKVILSRRVDIDADLDLLASYYLGRGHNTPARSFAVHFGQHRFIGFSPETVVEVSASGDVSTQPLAGTRSLTQDEKLNAQLREVLTGDTKEIAEHAVSVKLAFEELLTICETDSVRVTRFMEVSQRGSVQHLASRLRGHLAEGENAWRALQALFPAVTASGIPKRPALAAIARHESCLRGAYSGSVLMLSSDGDLDAALVLRSLFQLADSYAIQAGAGIIDQSLPERELEETIEKLQSVSRYLVRR